MRNKLILLLFLVVLVTFIAAWPEGESIDKSELTCGHFDFPCDCEDFNGSCIYTSDGDSDGGGCSVEGFGGNFLPNHCGLDRDVYCCIYEDYEFYGDLFKGIEGSDVFGLGVESEELDNGKIRFNFLDEGSELHLRDGTNLRGISPASEKGAPSSVILDSSGNLVSINAFTSSGGYYNVQGLDFHSPPNSRIFLDSETDILQLPSGTRVNGFNSLEGLRDYSIFSGEDILVKEGYVLDSEGMGVSRDGFFLPQGGQIGFEGRDIGNYGDAEVDINFGEEGEGVSVLGDDKFGIKSENVKVGGISTPGGNVVIDYVKESLPAIANINLENGEIISLVSGGYSDDQINLSSLITTDSNEVSSIAKKEYSNWEFGKLKECSPNGKKYLEIYYSNIGFGKYYKKSGENICKDVPWSAVFISYVLETAGVNDFPGNLAHSKYFTEIRDNEISSCETYNIYQGGYKNIKIGDIICKNRAGKSYTYSSLPIYSSGHCDVVVDIQGGTMSLIGGNVGQSVDRKKLKSSVAFSNGQSGKANSYYGYISCA